MLDSGKLFDVEKNKLEFLSSEKNVLLVAQVVSIAMTLLGITMAIITYLEGNMKMLVVSLIYGPLFFLAFIVTTITKRTRFFMILGYTLSFVMEFVYLITGGQEGFGILWMCITTFFTFFSNKKRQFFIINFFYLLFVILGFWSPLSKFCYQYPDTIRIRFPILYMIEFVFASYCLFVL